MNSYTGQMTGTDQLDNLRGPLMRLQSGVGLPHDKQPGPTARPSLRASASRTSLADNSSVTLHHQLPDGWEKFCHPSGYFYFRHKKWNIITSVPPLDFIGIHEGLVELQRRKVEDFFTSCRRKEWELVAYLVDDGGRVEYLVVDHLTHQVMAHDKAVEKLSQLDGHNTANDLESTKMEKAEEAIPTTQLDYLEEYWARVAQYPSHVVLTEKSSHEARDALMYCYSDRALFKRSSATWSLEDTKELLTIYDRLCKDGGILWTWFVACVIRASINDKIWSQRSQPDGLACRREHNDSIYERRWSRCVRALKKLFYWLVCMMFLGVPLSYCRRIEVVNRLDGVNTVRWRAFLAGLISEWRDCNLLGTVLIAATASLIAAPELSSISKTFCLVSIVTAIACVLLGVFFLWFHLPHSLSTGDIGLFYFEHAKGSAGNSMPLAFSLSTPVVLLAWSFISFILAVVTYAWITPVVVSTEDSAQTSAGTKSRFAPPGALVVSPVTGMVILTLAICCVSWWILPRNFATRAGPQEPQRTCTTDVPWTGIQLRTPSRRGTPLPAKKDQLQGDCEPSSSHGPRKLTMPFTETSRPGQSPPVRDQRALFPMGGRKSPHHSPAVASSDLRGSASNLTTPRQTEGLGLTISEDAPTPTRTAPADAERPPLQSGSGSSSAPVFLPTGSTPLEYAQGGSWEPPPVTLVGTVPQQVAESRDEDLIAHPGKSTRFVSVQPATDIVLPDVRVQSLDYGYTSSSASSALVADRAFDVRMASAGSLPAVEERAPSDNINPRVVALDDLVLALQTALSNFRKATDQGS